MILYPDKNHCCNCDSCTQICPKDAIYKITDKHGFVFPNINHEKCIDCGLCQKACAYQHIEEHDTPLEVYAATIKDSNLKHKSSSGGIFAAIAKKILLMGGIVYGAVMERNNGRFEIYHKGIEDIAELHRLQGSKYVQSEIRCSFKEIKVHLSKGKPVLFCGVPCQCAGLKAFLRRKYDNLYIVDIICHGVPSQAFFNDYIDYKFHDLPDITNFAFRDKSKGWELSARIDYDIDKHKYISAGTSSYYSLFLDSQIYRENCYSCKYASGHRAGDMTIGDYWGIQKEHPESLSKLKPQEGVSCIIINNESGKKILSLINDSVIMIPSIYQKAANMNSQLVRPSRKGKYYNDIMTLYQTHGYSAVESFFRHHYRKQRFIHTILSHLPYSIKTLLRSLKNK